MYQITWKLFALFPLILPILATPVPVPQEIGDLAGRLGERATGTHSGTGTFYTPGVGSCGGTNTPDQLVVAISAAIINTATDCGKTVQITSNGKTANGQIVDTCASCGPNDLDMSPALFQNFASPDVGVISIEWVELS